VPPANTDSNTDAPSLKLRQSSKTEHNALKSDNHLPGQRISVKHFICSTRGHLLTSAGKTELNEMYTGGCIFIDHASGFIFVEHQVSLNSHETLKVKERFERMCRNTGVTPQEYLADNSQTFTSAEFSRNLANFKQVIRFAGVGAHHLNGIAKRNIRTIMAIARTMMLHSAIHWPDVADPTLWPLAIMHPVFLVNHMPDPQTGLSPSDVFTKIRWEQRNLTDVHVWGCPVYVLDKMISDGKKLPCWTPRSTRTVNLGFSDKHASSVPLFSTRKLATSQLSFISSSTIGLPLSPRLPTTFRTSTMSAGNKCSETLRISTSSISRMKKG
jgi:hypothetical protein